MRLFVAIDFPEKVRDEVYRSIEPLRKQFPQVTWTKKENIHLTIKFLGNIDKLRAKSQEPRTLQKISEGIEKSIKDIKSFDLQFEKVGYFAREQLIIWIGFKPHEWLLMLVKNLDKHMKIMGFPLERRIYAPHVTVGRGKHLSVDVGRQLKNEIKRGEIKIPAIKVRKISLIESKLTPKGPIYKRVGSFNLQ